MNVSRRFHIPRKPHTQPIQHQTHISNHEIGPKTQNLKQVPMVFPGNKRGGGERQTAEEDMDRFKPLHNFDLPYLKWGNQKLLRCMKVDSTGDVSVLDRNQSPASGGGRRKGTDFENPRRSSDVGRKIEKISSSERIAVAGDGEIEATREKLMFDFQKEVGEMKDAILRERLVGPTTTTSFDSQAERPWNLRTRRARSPTNGVNGNGDVLIIESRRPKLKSNNGVSGNGVVNETPTERPKFSVSLSRRELEEDFMAMAGRRLPRKPKKRPRIVQKNLDTLFPGLWLSEITADLYKVPDEAETGKR